MFVCVRDRQTDVTFSDVSQFGDLFIPSSEIFNHSDAKSANASEIRDKCFFFFIVTYGFDFDISVKRLEGRELIR